MKLRRVKNLLGEFLSLLAGVLLLGLVFFPLPTIGVYVNTVLNLLLVLVPLYVIVELYFFAVDSPKRKSGALKKKKKNRARNVTEWTILGVLVLVILLARNGSIMDRQCPEVVDGTADAELRIKYFYNAFCPSCWRQEPIVKEIIETYDDAILVERYDVRYCEKDREESGVRMVPGFAVTYENQTTVRGKMSYSEFTTLVCNRIDCVA